MSKPATTSQSSSVSALQDLPNDWLSWEATRLEVELLEHNKRYWDENQAIISDYDYDRLLERLRELSPKSKVLDLLGPQAIGEVGEAVLHAAPMLSLEKCYNEDDLLKWSQKFEGPVIMSPKIDGLACSLRYDAGGKLYLAATRGDGTQGESITPNVAPMATIPQSIPPQGFEVEVRGEVYMPLSAFAHQTERFSNPRNAAAGTLKRKTERNAAEVGLKFFAYDLFGVDRAHASERLDLAEEWGFEPVPYEVMEREQMQSGYESYVAQRDDLDYEIDGVVYRAEHSAEYERLGATSHHPRGAIAYKLQGDSAKTTLIDVEWGVSRNGILTPVGITEPVKLSGAMVSRITLHHWGMVQAKNLSLGAEVIAMRRGGVIPHLETVVKAGPDPICAPTTCPQCPKLNAPTRIEGDVLYCNYQGTCEPQAAAILRHWVSVTKIEGFGSVWLETLTNRGILNTPVDLYTLTVEAVIDLDGVGQGRAQNWLDSINQSRSLPLATFLCALGVQDLGKSASQALAQRFISLDEMRKASAEEIAQLDNFGELTATHITSGLKVRSDLIDDLLKYIDVKDAEAANVSVDDAPLQDQSFVFTGTLVAMKRSEAQAKVKALGASTPSGVSAKLSYLVIGDAGKAGSKKAKAEKFGVSILSESEFLELLAKVEETQETQDASSSELQSPGAQELDSSTSDDEIKHSSVANEVKVDELSELETSQKNINQSDSAQATRPTVGTGEQGQLKLFD